MYIEIMEDKKKYAETKELKLHKLNENPTLLFIITFY